jgi:hypothetical protein
VGVAGQEQGAGQAAPGQQEGGCAGQQRPGAAGGRVGEHAQPGQGEYRGDHGGHAHGPGPGPPVRSAHVEPGHQEEHGGGQYGQDGRGRAGRVEHQAPEQRAGDQGAGRTRPPDPGRRQRPEPGHDQHGEHLRQLVTGRRPSPPPAAMERGSLASGRLRRHFGAVSEPRPARVG